MNEQGSNSKVLTVGTPREVNALLARLRDSADLTVRRLGELMKRESEPLRILFHLKFDKVGCDPLSPARELNLIEQLNQLFTYQASFQAVAWLLEHHPAHGPFVLNLGTSSGPDIASRDGQVVAEVFATVHPRNNKKLAEDIERQESRTALHRYVFYMSPKSGGVSDAYEVGGISIRRLEPWEPNR